jgi:hypothetical protein
MKMAKKEIMALISEKNGESQRNRKYQRRLSASRYLMAASIMA